MLILSKSILNVPIMSLQTGTRLGTSGMPIINPATLTIMAFFVNDSGITQGEQDVLMTNDVREVGQMGIIIDAIDDLSPLSDLVRLQEIVALGFDVMGLNVIDEEKSKLGRVVDYSFDPTTFTIHKLYLKPPLLKRFQTHTTQISRRQIIEVNNNAIIVRSATMKEQAQDKITSGEFINPFRTPQPKSQSDLD
jgi:uncharacterized protein YrrD